MGDLLGSGKGQRIPELIEDALVDRPAVEAGLSSQEEKISRMESLLLQGRRIGGTVFASFDRNVVDLVKAMGGDARLLTKE
jgi:hypothetical protein